MKNRDIINKMNPYDMLCRINYSIQRNNCECIIEALEQGNFHLRCRFGEYKGRGACEKCFADWLNEEATITSYERKSE